VREIGVRELKASLSETLRSVSHGERVRVTVHGRAVADIVPAGAVGEEDRLKELTAGGRLMPAVRPRPARAPRLAPATDSATAAVLAERDARR